MRKILGVILGYVVMAASVFISFSAAYLILGTDGSFKAGSFDVTPAWIVASIILSLTAAVLGGMTCRAIARSERTALVLSALVLVLGLVMAVPTLSTPDQSPMRTGEVAMMDAMQTARQPSWLAFLNPIIGAAGVIIGSRCCRKTAA